MKKILCTLLFLGVCFISISACGRKVESDNIVNLQDSSRAEEIAERMEKEEIKINKNAEGKQSAHEKRFEKDSAEPQ